MISKYKGCMLGAAIGDALGKQNEGLERKEILKRGYVTKYGKAYEGSPAEYLKASEYTDDTEQMLVLAKSLIKCNGFNIEDFSHNIAQWGANLPDIKKRLLGPSSSAAITRLNSGIHWKEAGSHIPSCGSAMRVAPIGLFYRSFDEIEYCASLSSIPTHNNQGSIAGAVAVAVGVGCALLGMDCSDIIKQSSIRASNYDETLGKKIELSFRKKDKAPDEVFSELGTSYVVYETIPCAFYCFSRYFDDAEKAVIEAVNAGGDTDSIACITGALGGALHGAEAFQPWIDGLENRKIVELAANLIFEKRIR